MKILLISNYLPDRQESMLRYAGLLERELRARGHEVTVARPPAVLRRWFGDRVPWAKWLAYIDKYLLAPSSLRRYAGRADIVHICDHSNSMYLKLFSNKPRLITCHDLLAVFAAQGRFSGIRIGWAGRMLQRWIARDLLRAPFVVCVSHKTQEDLGTLSVDSPPASTVIHNPLNWDFRRLTDAEAERLPVLRGFNPSDRFLLHVGGDTWYKNRTAAVRIFAALSRSPELANTKLVLAGRLGNPELREAVQSSGSADRIVELLNPSNEELRALYSKALALLFPSREEGFGWPILEAQACGCPVITTGRAPMTEVSGGHAILIDPDDPEAAAATVLSQLHLLPELAHRGLQHAKGFSVEKAIAQYISTYKELMKRT